MTKLLSSVVSIGLFAVSAAAIADPFALTDTVRCGAGNATGGLTTAAVTWGGAPATECWGQITKDGEYDGYTAKGNESQDDRLDKPDSPTYPSYPGEDSDQGFFVALPEDEALASFNGSLFERVVKYDLPGDDTSETTTGYNAYDVTIDNVEPGKSGTWSLSGASTTNEAGAKEFAGRAFLITLKSATNFAVWLFTGATEDSTYSGTWSVPWNKGLSHISVYVATSADVPPGSKKVPAPATIWLLLAGIAFAFSRRGSVCTSTSA